MKYLLISILVLSSTIALGQSSRPAQSDNIHTGAVQFREVGPVNGIIASPVIESPIQCSNGTAFVHMFDPPDFSQSKLYSVSPSSSAHAYSTKLIDDLYGVSVRRYYPTDNGVIMLVEATRSREQNDRTTVRSDNTHLTRNGYSGERGQFIVRFDQDGSYRGSVAIDDYVRVDQIAMFDSGVYLALGVENQIKRMHLLLIKADGTVLRFLDVSKEVTGLSDSQAKAVVKGMPDSFVMMPFTQFVRFQNNILVVFPGSNLPILEVRDTGQVRSISLQLPHGQMAHTIFTGESRWYVSTSPSGNSIDSSQVSLYEFDPSDGNLLRRLTTEGASVNDIACVDGQNFVAFQPGQNDTLVRWVGSIRN